MWVDAGAPAGLHLRAMLSVRRFPTRLSVSAFPGLFERAGERRVEGVEGVPVVVGVGGADVAAPVVALDDVEPVLDVVEGLAADVVDVGSAVVGVGAAFHEAGGAQDAEVLADEWLAASEGAREPGGGAGLVRERPDDPLAHPVGEQVQRGQGRWPGPPVAAGGLHVVSVMHRCFGVYPDRAQLCGLWAPGGGAAGRVCTTRGPFLTFLRCQGNRAPRRTAPRGLCSPPVVSRRPRD